MATMQDRLRSTFERVQPKFQNFMMQTGVLRREIPLASTQNTYKISLKSGEGNDPNGASGGEVFLDQNDAFVLCALAIGIKKQDTSLATKRYGNYQVYTYPDPQTFVGAPASNAEEWEALLTIWNGTLSFRTNTLQRIKAISSEIFLYVPPTQVTDPIATSNTASAAYAGNGQTNPRLAQYGGWDWESQGFKELQPTLLLDGSENNQFELTLGAGNTVALDGSWTSGGAQTATTRNVLVVQAMGLLIPDGAKSAKEFSKSWALVG